MLRNSSFYRNTFKARIANYLGVNPKNVFLFWKGRVALYAILKTLRIKKGDEVILPAFTCVVAVNPIIYLGAKPVYVDIDPKTYNLDVSRIENKITSRTKGILAQNTFGLSPDLDAVFEIARKYNLWVIEDCAHGFGGYYKGKPNGTIADASFFSCQWNKPFSTGLGGIAISKNPKITKKLKEYEEKFTKPKKKEELMLKVLIFVREHFLNSQTYWFALKTYRTLSKHNLILGSSQGEELEKPMKPENFEKGFSEAQAKKGMKGLKSFSKVLEHRKEIVGFYKGILKGLDIKLPYEPDYATHTYLKFPLLVTEKEKFFAEAIKRKIELGDWFLSPIHPITQNFEYWYYNWGENPIAERESQHIVNLPTHTKIDENYVDRIAEFLKENRNSLLKESRLPHSGY